MKRTGIIGAGIAGLTTAIALRKTGVEARIFEATPEIKPLGAGLILAANALKAFQKLGIHDPIAAAGNALKDFAILNEKGNKLSSTPPDFLQKYGVCNFSIHRASLHEILLSYIDPKNLVLNKRAEQLVQTSEEIKVLFADGTSESFEQLIVADGIHSPIRQQLVPGSVPRYAGYTCWRAVVDYPQALPHVATETWGTKGRFGLVPLPGNRVYYFICINGPRNSNVLKHYTTDDLLPRFKNYHAPIPDLLKHTRNEQLIWNDIIDLVPVKKYAFGKVVLIGDAAHATTPNMGQGACQAIEDAVVLSDEMTKNRDSEKAFAAFEKRRLERTHWVVNTSFQIGNMAQIENEVLAALRNGLFKMMPSSLSAKPLDKLYRVDF